MPEGTNPTLQRHVTTEPTQQHILMAPPRGWADLPAELLLSIADRLIALKSYLAARGVCAAWRAALAAPSPCLLFVLHLGADAQRPVLAVSHALDRPFHLCTLGSSSGWCVGSSGGWLAVLALLHDVNEAVHVVLVNPHTGQEVALPILQWERRLEPTWPCVRFKVVFARNPKKEEFTVVAVCGDKTVAFVSSRDETWSFHEIVRDDTELADVVCHDDGAGSKFYCLTKRGDVLSVHVPRGGRGTKPPVLEPLLPGGVPSDPNRLFPPPYAGLSEHINAKYLVFCEVDMYQVWRNTGAAVDLPQLPGREAPFHVSENEVFVLRYAPASRRGPCWEAVEDVGGRAVFVGLNNAVTVRAEGVPGLRADCVYWASELEDGAIMFDMRTRCSAPCLAPSLGATCWHVLGGR